MTFFLILFIASAIPLVIHYFAFYLKLEGVKSNPFKNKKRLLYFGISNLLFGFGTFFIFNSINNPYLGLLFQLSGLCFTVIGAILSLSVEIEIFKKIKFNFFVYERYLSSKVINLINKKTLERDFEVWIKRNVISGSEESFKCFALNLPLGNNHKLFFIYEGLERKGSPKLTALFALYDRYYDVIKKYNMSQEGTKFEIIKEMHLTLDKYFEPFDKTKFIPVTTDLGTSNMKYIRKFQDQFFKFLTEEDNIE